MYRILKPLSLASAAVVLSVTTMSHAQIVMDWSVVGNSGNKSDPTTGFGAVSYKFRIGTHEVTNDQYTVFLNAVAAVIDPNGLYNTLMGSDARGGITRIGVPGNFTYTVKPNMGNKPVNFVGWFDAARMANWMTNGQGSGSTEFGAYTFTGPTTISAITRDLSNPDQVFIPTNDEWFKAGYYQPASQGGDFDDYWLYATRSNSVPTIASATPVGDVANPGANVVNYGTGADWNSLDGNVTTVGSAGSTSFYEAFDMTGNVWEWTETVTHGPPLTTAIVRGGGIFSGQMGLWSTNQFGSNSANENLAQGFRFASSDVDCAPQWAPTFGGTQAVNNTVEAMTVFDDGNGPALYAGGSFTTAGGVTVNNIAKWNGSSWSPLGSGTNGLVRALAVFDDGDGPALYAGGFFTSAGGAPANYIAKWDGKSWSPLESGLNDWVGALEVFDDGSGLGPALYVGGFFTEADGVPADRIAVWLRDRVWYPFGPGGVSGGLGQNWIQDMTVFDDGDGPALYMGGQFTTAGGVSASNIAKWDGVSCSPLGSGVNAAVFSLTVFDDGSGPGDGPALYAGGGFTTAGGGPANRIAKWNGASWTPLGNGVNNNLVYAMTVFERALYVGGGFTTVDGESINLIARWDGSNWSPLDSGANGSLRDLIVFDDRSGPALYAGGLFTVPTVGVSNIAKWQGCSATERIPGDLNGDGVVNGQDLLILLNGWGPCPQAPDECPGDLNNDGVVDGVDLLILLSNWT